MTVSDKSVASLDQREAWEILQRAMRTGAVNPGIRPEVENELLAKARFTGLFPFKKRLWWVLVSGPLLMLPILVINDWKYWYAVLPLSLVFDVVAFKFIRARSLADVRRVLAEDRIAFHGLIDSDSIRPRLNPKVAPPPFTAETLAQLIMRSRPG